MLSLAVHHLSRYQLVFRIQILIGLLTVFRFLSRIGILIIIRDLTVATTWVRHKYKYEICICNKTDTHNKNEKATEITEIFANVNKLGYRVKYVILP